MDDELLVHVDHLGRRVLLVRDVDERIVAAELEHLRARPGGDLVDDLERRDVDHVDDVIVAAGDVEHGLVGIELHVARATGGGDRLDQLIAGAVEDGDVVGALIADEDVAGAGGRGGVGRGDEGQGGKPDANEDGNERCASSHL